MGLTRRVSNRKVDDKECWEQYMSWGAAASHVKLRAWLLSEKGIRVTQMTPFWAMWRYACRNPQEAFPAYQKWWAETAFAEKEKVIDPNVTYEQFLDDCKTHARNCMGRGEYKRWLIQYGFNSE